MGVKMLFAWQATNVAAEQTKLKTAMTALDALPPNGQPMPWHVRYSLSRQVNEGEQMHHRTKGALAMR
jgi:hypothetical protein